MTVLPKCTAFGGAKKLCFGALKFRDKGTKELHGGRKEVYEAARTVGRISRIDLCPNFG
jgi:hypothetical protein